MKSKQYILIISLFLLWAFVSNAQNNIVSNNLDTTVLQSLSPKEKIHTINHIIDSLYTSEPDECLKYSSLALSIAEKNEFKKEKLDVLIRTARIYWEKSDYKTSLSYANQVKASAAKDGFDKEYAESLIIISRIYTTLSDHEKSSELSFEALKIFENLEDKKGLISALDRIGNIYFDQGKWDKALEYSYKSLELSREINDLLGISRGLNNVAAIYANIGELDSFEEYIKEAIIINKKLGRKKWEAVNYFNLAIVKLNNEEYDLAFMYYQKSEALLQELQAFPKLADIYTDYSKYYEAIGNKTLSLGYVIKAYDLAKSLKLITPLYFAVSRLQSVYFKRNDIDSSYKYLKIQFQLKDSLDLEQSSNHTMRFELLYEVEKQEHEREIKQAKLRFFYIISATLIISFFLLFIIILIARHRLKVKNSIIKRKELEGELEIKNKELTTNVMSLMRKNEILSDIADKLLLVKEDAVKDETKQAIKKIAKELQQSTDKEIWEEFEVRFQQVHIDFYENLLKQHPNLSANEQRLCAFLRLNMTTKEISELTGQRAASLETARTRLRKKLGIVNTKENLFSFLSRI